MFQLSLTTLLALSISANLVLTVEIFRADTSNLQNESSLSVLKNNNQTKESPMTHEELSKNITRNKPTLKSDQQKIDTPKEEAKDSVTLSNSKNGTVTSLVQNVTPSVTRPTEETTPVTEEEIVTQKAGNFTGEQANLNQCCVRPRDEDEKDTVPIETPKENVTTPASASSTTSPLIVITLNSTNTNTNETISDDTIPPKFFPDNKNVKNITNVSSDIATRLNSTLYKTFPPDVENITETTTLEISKSTVVTTTSIPSIPTTTIVTTKTIPTTTAVTAKVISTTIPTSTVIANVAINASTILKNNQTTNASSKMAVEGLGNVEQAAELSEKGKESNEGSKNESMSSGVIALVTAITFAAAIAIGYISMVVWKQYLEHRYGRRELLVNELEFDTNDLRHFEL